MYIVMLHFLQDKRRESYVYLRSYQIMVELYNNTIFESSRFFVTQEASR